MPFEVLGESILLRGVRGFLLSWSQDGNSTMEQPFLDMYGNFSVQLPHLGVMLSGFIPTVAHLGILLLCGAE